MPVGLGLASEGHGSGLNPGNAEKGGERKMPAQSVIEGPECTFIEVDGVTVMIGLKGGIPLLRTYDEGFETAACAYSLSNKRRRHDGRD